ncbi:MAG: endonuclease MutS2 [Ignavibacteriae bacterium]|nr:endonuclease MutS2 [Ignavibacteriota bacterium]
MDRFQHAIEKLEFEKVRQRVCKYAASEIGRSFLESARISTSLNVVQHNLVLVSELKHLLEEENGLPLEGVHSVREPIQKAGLEGTVLTPKELSQISSTLRAARNVRQFIQKRQQSFPKIWSIAENLHTDKVLEYNLDQAIDETGSIRPNASKELQSIRRGISEKYEQTRKLLAGILKNVSELGFAQEDIITTREGRMVIPVKSEHKNRVHGFIHSASASGATVFVEPSETLDLNNEIRSLQFQEQREIERILRELTRQVGNERDQLQANLLILAELDAIHAKAKYSLEIIGIEPTLTPTGGVKLFHARHPLLLLSHGRDATVPLEMELGESFKTLIISGPNAGGKSVAMKTVGLLTLMAQFGLHVPASEPSVLRVFQNIFVDIGDEQSIENDLSTFSSHLRNLKEILEGADSESLVLIDEVGSGTDPAEGGAIAAAFLESLTRRGTHTIATTHHSALKVFAHDTDGVENGAMEFDQATLTPTYRFKSGVPGSSYALEMAQRLGFSENSLRRSREFMGQQQAKLENLIADLEAAAQRHRSQLEAVETEKSRLDSLVQQYESRLASQSAELRELKRRAVAEAEEIVENANAMIERSIREIKEKSAEKQAIVQVRQQITKAKEELRSQREELQPEEEKSGSEALEVGDFAKLTGGLETGEIVSISQDQRTAVIVFGNMKMKVATKDLVKAKKRSSTYKSPLTESEKPAEILRDLDLRGMTGDEAIPLVDKFIDTAMLVGLHRVDIIHGKGTGALRKKVTEYLSKHPRVKSFRIAEWNEGGTGATVVELSGS